MSQCWPSSPKHICGTRNRWVKLNWLYEITFRANYATGILAQVFSISKIYRKLESSQWNTWVFATSSIEKEKRFIKNFYPKQCGLSSYNCICSFSNCDECQRLSYWYCIMLINIFLNIYLALGSKPLRFFIITRSVQERLLYIQTGSKNFAHKIVAFSKRCQWNMKYNHLMTSLFLNPVNTLVLRHFSIYGIRRKDILAVNIVSNWSR